MRLKPLVLAVDDDPFFQKALEVILPRMGFNAKVVGEPDAFVAASQELAPDLHLIDLKLASSSGFDLVEQIREKTPNSLIIVISGSDQKADIVHALERGANDFILKPLDGTLLASKLAKYLSTERLADHQSKSVEITSDKRSAKLSFSLSVSSFDELGVGLKSKHLIPKGTVFKLKCDFLREIGAPTSEVLVSAVTTEFDPESEMYSVYAEFADPSPEFSDALCKGLQKS